MTRLPVPAGRVLLLALFLVTAASTCVGPSTPADSRRVRFSTHEGSFLSFDVSADGRWIVLDLLGELWRLPIGGGTARPISDVVRDTADFADPVLAPDGGMVLARGEWRGHQGFFTVSMADGSARWIANDSVRWFSNPLTLSPSWSRDMRRLLFARRPAGQWICVERMVETGAERVLAISDPPQADCHSPMFSPDERDIYFASPNNEPLTFPAGGQIWRIAAAGGKAQAVTPAGLRARAPVPSPDGRHLAYLVMDSLNRAHVHVQALADSASLRLTDEPDVQATRVRWLGNDTLLYVAAGRLWRRPIGAGPRREIPFTATIDFVRKAPVLPPIEWPAPGAQIPLQGTSNFTLSPDGRAIAVMAANQLWIAPADSGAVAHPIARLPTVAAWPHWSPGGARLAWFGGPFGEEDLYVTDTVSRQTSRLTMLPGTELRPQWSPDGRYLTFLHISHDASGITMRQRAVPATALEVRTVAETMDLGAVESPGHGGPPWSPSSDALLILGPMNDVRARAATLRTLDGSPSRSVRGLPERAMWVQWLPGDTLVFVDAGRLFRAPFDVRGGVVGPGVAVSDEPAILLAAALNGDLLYVSDDGLRLRRRGEPPTPIGWPVRLTVPTPPALLIRNVRIIDGTGTGPSAPRDIVVDRGRVTRLVEAGSAQPLPGSRIVDAGGRVAIPGLIDLHSHHRNEAELRGLLYFGVTTVRSLGLPFGVGAVDAGAILGSRQAGSQFNIYPDWPFDIGSLAPEADAQHLDRLVRLSTRGHGSTWIKVYGNSGWPVQVRTVTGGHALGARVTGHCAFPLTVVAAGIDAKEHVGRQCTIRDAGVWYDDLVQLYAHSGVAIVPTLSLFLGLERRRSAPLPLPEGLEGLFTPGERTQLEGYFAGPPTRPAFLADYAHALRATRDLHQAGAVIGTGSDYERPDGIQYELEALVEASFTPLEAIAAATSVAAQIMGADRDLGRLATGFLADIVILDADPAQDIRNARHIWSVIQGGRVVDRRALVAAGWDSLP